MTNLTTNSCRSCNELADHQDGLCSVCRAEGACTGLAEDITNALEIFLDARYSPHNGPAYYRKSPAFGEDAAELTEIGAACEQVTAGVKRLIELALGRKVEVDAGPWHDFYGCGCAYDGWHACLEWWDEAK
jgi:hypothetical protein